MITHIALYRWKPDTTPERIDSFLRSVRGLARAIPEILGIWAGPNRHPHGAAEFSHVIIAHFEDEAGLATYRTHPAHAAIAEAVFEMAERRLGVDFGDSDTPANL
jgi:hypothetical protein